MLDLKNVDPSWTLFLDRDGVINHEKKMDYVYHYNEFVFYDRVQEALKIFSKYVGKMIIVTNQRGVGRGLMSENDLLQIHVQMIEDIRNSGGRIDEIFYCISTDNEHPDRKPNPGMAYLAQKKFPLIDLKKSIMVGNNLSDMQFGRNAGMFTVHVRTTHPDIKLPHELIDMSFANLFDFATALQTAKENSKY
ncbi:MAG: HAD-IIIA family hydrolase [Chitinophagaceae bacterium]|nr:HAD-IIIA family hydrolase [Chitinophagaceae bacterium]